MWRNFNYSLETKKMTFFAKNLIGKCQNSKSRGPWRFLRPLPTPMADVSPNEHWFSSSELELDESKSLEVSLSVFPWLLSTIGQISNRKPALFFASLPPSKSVLTLSVEWVSLEMSGQWRTQNLRPGHFSSNPGDNGDGWRSGQASVQSAKQTTALAISSARLNEKGAFNHE